MKNVVLLTIDALWKKALGCYITEQGLTPIIDSLHSKCIRLAGAQASSPYAQDSFRGILTSSENRDNKCCSIPAWMESFIYPERLEK